MGVVAKFHGNNSNALLAEIDLHTYMQEEWKDGLTRFTTR